MHRRTVSGRIFFGFGALAAAAWGARAAAQPTEADTGNLLSGAMAGVVLVVIIAAVIVLVRRGRARRQEESADKTAVEAVLLIQDDGGELPATVFSPMGIMTANASGPLSGSYFQIKESGLTIGRNPRKCAVVYDADIVSREHARLHYGPEGLVLTNLSTKNPTLLNDRSITREVVRPGDRIRIGRVTFVVQGTG